MAISIWNPKPRLTIGLASQLILGFIRQFGLDTTLVFSQLFPVCHRNDSGCKTLRSVAVSDMVISSLRITFF